MAALDATIKPEPSWVTLTHKETMGKTFVIGDIHGAFLALLQCLERSGFDMQKDTLITLGDIADGYSQTYECVEKLLLIKNRIDIQGNHDWWTLQWMQNLVKRHEHRTQGGQATYNSYENNLIINPYEDAKEHYQFFRNQIPYYVDAENRLFVHGGFDRNFDIIEGEDCHNYSWNRSMWNQALSCADGVKLTTVNDFTEIFIGHTTTMCWNTMLPMNRGGVWNLDTGGGYHGKVTIMNVDTHEYWQSDPTADLYPMEQGRQFRTKV